MRTVLALFALGLLATPVLAQDGETPTAPTATVGQPAPDFTLTDGEGNTYTLADYRGQIVVLEWTNPGCPFVVRHYQSQTMSGLIEELGEGVVWLTINSTHARHRDAESIAGGNEGQTWPTLLDSDGTVGRAYSARTTPHMFVITADGTLAYDGAIDNDPRGRLDRDDPEYVNYVRQAVHAVRAGEQPATTTSEPYGCSVKYEDA
jgi:peroxiredoxin